eukprot:2376200-Pleurochrysis_carterae.AAC.1
MSSPHRSSRRDWSIPSVVCFVASFAVAGLAAALAAALAVTVAVVALGASALVAKDLAKET